MANFLNRLQTLLFGAAVGRASSDAVTPVLEPVRQEAWTKNQYRVLDPNTAAEARAKGVISEQDAEDDASRSGVNAQRFGALLRLAQTYPGLAELDKMSNRDLLGPGQLDEALTRHGIPADWQPHVRALFQDLASVAEVAAGVQQGHLANHGGSPDSGPILPNPGSFAGYPPRYEQAPSPDGHKPTDVPLTQLGIDPVVEAAGQGIDVERLKLAANLSGLPPGAAELLTLWNRNLISEEAVDAGLREGHLKTKWLQAFKRMRWAVLGASEYANAYIRAWITQDEMYQGGALTGHTPDQMDLMYKNRGRPMATVQAFTAWARKAPHPNIPGEPNRPGTFDYQDFEEAVRRSDVQTWYAPVLWALRYAYPSLFQLRQLAQAGDLAPERVRTILEYERYEPQDIDAMVKAWTTPTGSKANPYIGKADNQLWTALHKAFVKTGVPEAEIEPFLAHLIPQQAVRTQVFADWTRERQVDALPGQ